MKFRNLHKFQLSSELEGIVFFAQRMDELLFDYSLDSYKPSALNAPFLCGEALTLINEIENQTIDAANLQYVLDELSWSISNDKIAKRLLDVPLEKYLLNDLSQLGRVKLGLEVLSKTLNARRYLNECHQFIKTAVAENKKKDIDFGARTLVTTLINWGLSKSFLHQSLHDFFYRGDDLIIDNIDDIDLFLETIAPIIHHFDVYFLASKEIISVEKSIKSFSIEILSDLPGTVLPYAASHCFLKAQDEVFVKIDNIETYDAYTARQMAERRIDTLKDLFTLFSHKNDLRWRPDTLIVQCCTENPKIVGKPKSSMTKSVDMTPSRASKRLNWMLQNISLSNGETGSFDKFHRIVDLHGICVSNEIPENQLLNIWISIETLVPSHGNKNKITNIIELLDPIFKLTYITRLANKALADLLLWNAGVTSKILRRVPDSSHTKAAVRLLQLLILESNLPLRDELFEKLKDFHLLRFRLFSLANSLKTPEKVTKLLGEHSKKVAWQLRRLYRTRNLLVHSGRTPTFLSTLIENGHDYLDTALNQIMERTCGHYQITTMEQVFELERILLQRFESELAGIKEFDSSSIKSLYFDSEQGKTN